MNIKTLISFCALFICILSFGQSTKSSKKSLKNIDLTIEKGTYEADASFSADKLILNNTKGQDTTEIVFNENEWMRIKARIAENKERVVSTKEIFTSKVIDTIYVDIPSKNSKTQLSGW